jgi:hypothetical protein
VARPVTLGLTGGRPAALDPLRDNNFWLFDVAPIELAPALPLFTPLSGFSAISSPEITVETQDINEGNWPFKKTVVKSASVGSITLSRGVTWYSADFWNWIQTAIQGTTGTGLLPVAGLTYRRSLLLVHFFRNLPFAKVQAVGKVGSAQAIDNAQNTQTQAALATAGTAGLSIAAGLVAGADTAALGVSTGVASGLQLASLQMFGGFVATKQIGIKVPARAFLLKNCIPTRYKSGSDFDATSGQISIQEMDIQPELIEEISLGA